MSNQTRYDISQFLPSDFGRGARSFDAASPVVFTLSNARATAIGLPGFTAHARLRFFGPTIFGTGKAPCLGIIA